MTDRIFGPSDWLAWLDQRARALFGMSGPEFEAAYSRGELRTGSADDLASVLPLIAKLRARAGKEQP